MGIGLCGQAEKAGVEGVRGWLKVRLNPATGQIAVAVIDAKHRGDKAHQGVFILVPLAIGKGDIPKRLDHIKAVVMVDRILDGTGEADGIGGLGLERLCLSAQGLGLARQKAVAIGQKRINAGDFHRSVIAIGAGNTHQKGGKRKAGIGLGKRFRGGGQEAAEQI